VVEEGVRGRVGEWRRRTTSITTSSTGGGGLTRHFLMYGTDLPWGLGVHKNPIIPVAGITPPCYEFAFERGDEALGDGGVQR
jgi:hypothetical protein